MISTYLSAAFIVAVVFIFSREWVFYTNKCIPAGSKGRTLGTVICIIPSEKENVGLLQHEKTHVAQFWSSPLTHSIRYIFSKQYKFDCEVEAYAVQSKYYNDDKIPQFAVFISEKYNLNVTREVAEKAIRDKVAQLKE